MAKKPTKKAAPHSPHKDPIPAPAIPRPENVKYSYEQMADAMQRSFGKVTVAARLIGCDRTTLYDAFKKHPELKEVGAKAEDFVYEMAVVHVMQGAANGNREDIDRLLLHTKKGLLLGFANRIELTGAEGGPLEVVDAVAIRSKILARFHREDEARAAQGPTGSA